MKPVKVKPPRIGPRNPSAYLRWSHYDYQGHGELHAPRVDPKGADPRQAPEDITVCRPTKREKRKKYNRGSREYYAGGLSSFELAKLRKEGL